MSMSVQLNLEQVVHLISTNKGRHWQIMNVSLESDQWIPALTVQLPSLVLWVRRGCGEFKRRRFSFSIWGLILRIPPDRRLPSPLPVPSWDASFERVQTKTIQLLMWVWSENTSRYLTPLSPQCAKLRCSLQVHPPQLLSALKDSLKGRMSVCAGFGFLEPLSWMNKADKRCGGDFISQLVPPLLLPLFLPSQLGSVPSSFELRLSLACRCYATIGVTRIIIE